MTSESSSRLTVWRVLGETLIWIPRLVVPLFLVLVTVHFGRVYGLAVYHSYFVVPDEVKVPEVVGTDVQQAQEVLRKIGLELDLQEARYRSNVKKDRIIEQDPPPGREVRRGRKVAVVWSLGPELVTVPKVVDKSVREARIALSNARLNVGKITKSAKKAGEPEVVLTQNPSSGKSVKMGTNVSLVVNEGAEDRIKVPMFQGQPIDTVRESLKSTELRLGAVEWVVHQSIAAGTVVRQIPTSNTLVAPGTELTLKVSVGTDINSHNVRQKFIRLRVPDVAGPQDIRVVLRDGTGTCDVYQGIHYAREPLTLMVTAMTPQAELEIYSGDKVLERMKL